MKGLMELGALELGKKIRLGETDAVSAAKASLAAIEEKEEALHAFLHVLPKETVLQNAKDIQRRIENGELSSPLAGVPFAVKDNLCVDGVPTTCASEILAHYVPTYTAAAVQNLIDAGCLLIGKTNMDEFAMGSTTETSCFGPSRNPYDLSRSPGGSSGGSAVSVAAGEVSFALGTDTGGSVRQPASLCGVFGWKPGYGLVSRSGLIAYASSLDVIGTLTRDVSDALALLPLLAEKDPADQTQTGGECLDTAEPEPKKLRIGIPKDLLTESVDPEIRNVLNKEAEKRKAEGAEVSEFDLGLTDALVPTYYTIACAEAGSNLERYDGVKYGYRAEGYEGLTDMYKKTRSQGFGAEVKRRILMGTFVLSREYYDQYYRKALKLRTLIREAFEKAFSSFDLLLTPVTPGPAPLLGEYKKNPVMHYTEDLFTVGANLAGLPAISFPAGKTKEGLPIGLQLIGPWGSDLNMLRSTHPGSCKD